MNYARNSLCFEWSTFMGIMIIFAVAAMKSLTEKYTIMAKDRVYIFDTTLRDGEQVPGCQLNTIEKIEVAKALEELRSGCY